MGPELRRLGPADWRVWRDVRLAALLESPHAFASSWAKEHRNAEADWRAWLDPSAGLKVVAGDDAGLVGVWDPGNRHGAAELFSMWVSPRWRGRGVADRLVDEALDWAADQGYARIDLWVADGNVAAERFYRRRGFRATGECQPHPGHPGVLERAMTRGLPCTHGHPDGERRHRRS